MPTRVVNPRPVNTRRFREQRRRHVTTRARGLQRVIADWILEFAEVVVEEEIGLGVTKVRGCRVHDPAFAVLWMTGKTVSRTVTKAVGDATDQAMKSRLAEILRVYGLRQLSDSGKAASGVTPILSATAVADFMRGKDVLVQNLADQTRDIISGEIRQIIIESLDEVPRPSVGTVSRRIRNTYLSPAVGDEPPFVVSSERAMLIARTELVQAENTGIVEGYKAVGIEEMEWLAFTDGKSGDRHHELMNGKTIQVGQKFTTPLGNELRFPGDPLAPIKDTAN